MSSKLVIGMLGFGTVGGGVAALLRPYYPSIRIKKICVRDMSKSRDVDLPEGCKLVDSADEILTDVEINCVVELIGGTGLAKEVMVKAVNLGKHVVTANKAALSMYMDEFQTLLEKKEQRVGFLYEGAICGGIPIVSVIRRGLSCDRIRKVVGIMNGTTNYMLSKMSKEGISFSQALEDAQQRGYAESDPTADVDGLDARSKLCVISKLAFGLTINEQQVYCEGIQRITNVDFEYARMIKYTIKLLAIAELREEGHAVVQASVSPVMVPLDKALAGIDGVTNVVEISSDNLGSSLYVGAGAGRYPTANSVVADILEIVSRLTTVAGDKITFPPAFPNSSLTDRVETDFTAEYFVRFVVKDQIGVVHKISGVCADYGISIFSILQTPIKDPEVVPFAIITDSCKLSQVSGMCKEIASQRKGEFSFIKEMPMFIRYYK